MERRSDRPRPTQPNDGNAVRPEDSAAKRQSLRPRAIHERSPPSAPPPSRPRVASSLVATACAITAVGCIQPPRRAPVAIPAARDQDESAGRPHSFVPPFELIRDEGADNDGVVRVVGDVTCTGALIADDLILTAHHCVAARDPDGKALPYDVDASALTIELGGDYLPWGEVGARAIVSPDCGYTSGKGDIAIVVLSRRLIGVPIATPRLDSSPERGEQVAPVGFGRCGTSPNAIQRIVREGGAIVSIGDSMFVAPASICPGDSGGPVYSSRSEVVGVISASVMDGDDRTVGPSVFTRLDVWRRLFSAAKEIAAGSSPSELPPFRSCEP